MKIHVVKSVNNLLFVIKFLVLLLVLTLNMLNLLDIFELTDT